MNLKELKEMVELMNENGLAELEIERDGMKIKLKKAADNTISVQPVSYTVPTIPAVASRPAIQSAAPAVTPVEDKGHLKEVKSPMVGTFYRAPSPEAAPFVEMGHTVEVGQVVCIVEAMKLLNEIKSEVRGKVVEICVDNAEPVEFGQIMFRVDPSK
ncbi:MAG: acetyl-CoA carboxylase biotin carboxyl carrier protein [Candidatus Omnitrophica bacterium]|nr:acetyl-CoA carboxylase biotin carboxyl carrier protein [Candidatus Omnitrophota bacterium]